MKILVIGGMHGNEPLGKDVVQLFIAARVQNVDAILANEQAITQDRRFVKNDLNRSFPGDIASKDYETKRAAELMEMTKGYDIALDFHNTHCPENDCGFVGDNATREIYDISAWLGLNRVIVADYDCINKYAPNCLSIEISLSSSEMDAKGWYEKITQLATLAEVPRSDNMQKFRFVYRMTLDDKERLNLADIKLEAFKPITPELAEAFCVKNPAYPIFIGDKYTPYNYGGLLNRLNVESECG